MYLLGLTLPVNPSDCFEKSYKNKAFINVNIMHFRERLVCRNALGDTHTHTLTQSSGLCQHDERSPRPTRLGVGIPVQGLKSCQIIFSMRCPVFFFSLWRQRREFNVLLQASCCRKARLPPHHWNRCHPAAGYHHSRFTPSLDKQIYHFPLAGNHTARVPPVDLSG